ncbi:DUF2790 domain-containing protein [Pseudomonas sp. NPDC088444]|uniref:DUF2790 domain-containing protein n=1 Tax=Pseudomonas sp. NPDC088444 TaxID=3364456 RepID=UPI00384B4E68
MNTKLIALTFVALSACAANVFADNNQARDIQEYTYGTKLDIAEVTMSPDLNFCGVRPVVMSYVDHMGKPHNLRYEASGDGCLGEN